MTEQQKSNEVQTIHDSDALKMKMDEKYGVGADIGECRYVARNELPPHR